MSERLQTFRNLVDDRQNKWRSFVGLPYVEAYTAAYEKYKKRLDDQTNSDEARGELFVAAAGIAGRAQVTRECSPARA